jgi:hypothetical protein
VVREALTQEWARLLPSGYQVGYPSCGRSVHRRSAASTACICRSRTGTDVPLDGARGRALPWGSGRDSLTRVLINRYTGSILHLRAPDPHEQEPKIFFSLEFRRFLTWRREAMKYLLGGGVGAVPRLRKRQAAEMEWEYPSKADSARIWLLGRLEGWSEHSTSAKRPFGPPWTGIIGARPRRHWQRTPLLQCNRGRAPSTLATCSADRCVDFGGEEAGTI